MPNVALMLVRECGCVQQTGGHARGKVRGDNHGGPAASRSSSKALTRTHWVSVADRRLIKRSWAVDHSHIAIRADARENNYNIWDAQWSAALSAIQKEGCRIVLLGVAASYPRILVVGMKDTQIQPFRAKFG